MHVPDERFPPPPRQTLTLTLYSFFQSLTAAVFSEMTESPTEPPRHLGGFSPLRRYHLVQRRSDRLGAIPFL